MTSLLPLTVKVIVLLFGFTQMGLMIVSSVSYAVYPRWIHGRAFRIVTITAAVMLVILDVFIVAAFNMGYVSSSREGTLAGFVLSVLLLLSLLSQVFSSGRMDRGEQL